jgi:hypothetical protein
LIRLELPRWFREIAGINVPGMQSPMLVHRSLVFLAALLDRLLARADLEAGTSGIFSTQHVRRWPQDIDQQSADRRFLALDDRAFCIICAASRPAVAPS